MHARIEDQFHDRMRMLVAIAHDLRTPLTALRLRVETTPGGERARQVSLIRRMERMIQEILDYAASSRREAAEVVDVSDLVQSQLPAVDASGAPIRFSGEAVSARLPPTKLSRAVANLVDNAVRYAQDIEVSVAAQGKAVVVVVADRGPGVADSELERIQEPFERIEASRSRRTGGIGLGLTISRNLAIEMNGALVLENRGTGGLSATLIIDRSVA
jgi:signal transduction histidine kinase